METPLTLPNWRFPRRAWTHPGIVAYFEAGGLGQTPMNLHRPTDRPRERRKVWRRHTALTSRNSAVNQRKVWKEKSWSGSSPLLLRFTSLAGGNQCGIVIGVDKPAPLLYLLSHPPSSLPLHTTRKSSRCAFFIPLVATPFAGVDAPFSAGFPRFFISLVWLLKPGFSSEVSQTCLRGEELHSGRTMRWVKRLKSLHLHCVSRLHFVFRPLVSQKATVQFWPYDMSL